MKLKFQFWRFKLLLVMPSFLIYFVAINNFQSKGSVSLCQKGFTVLFGLGCEIISLYVKMFKFVVVSDHHFHLVSSIVCTQPYSFFFPFSASFPWEKVSYDYFAMQLF